MGVLTLLKVTSWFWIQYVIVMSCRFDLDDALGDYEDAEAPRECEEDAEDLFEKEMEQEMIRRMKKAESDGGLQLQGSSGEQRESEPQAGPSTSSSKESKNVNKDKYDDMYFDSDDDDDEVGAEERKRQRTVVNNDDLFYDPDEDDDNQKYVDELRAGYRSKKQKKGDKAKSQKLPNSDATLNCPACFALLCLDCQRHDLYENQYRAMFVMNCKVITSERLHRPLSKSARKGKQNKTAGEESEMFNPVKCEQCNTEVAVYDKDEVYHFFNVMAGY